MKKIEDHIEKCEVMESCMQLFVQQGVKSVSIEDIVRSTNQTKKALYDHFGNKEGIIRSVTEYDGKQTKQLFEHLRANADNAIREMLHVHAYFMKRFDNINPVLFFDLTKYYNSIYREHQTKKLSCNFEFILGNLQRGIGEGLYREEIDKDVVAKLWVYKIQTIQEQNVFPLREYDIHYITQQFTELHLRSIASTKGLEIINKTYNHKQQ